MDEDVTIKLTRAEFNTLLLLLGYATGAAMNRGDEEWARRFFLLADAVNRDNPAWTPYRR